MIKPLNTYNDPTLPCQIKNQNNNETFFLIFEKKRKKVKGRDVRLRSSILHNEIRFLHNTLIFRVKIFKLT